MTEFPYRKPTRLKDYDYSTKGLYFITICTTERKQILSRIFVGDDAHIVPHNKLSSIGLICEKYINNICKLYDNTFIDKYVIMPNHIHFIFNTTQQTNIDIISIVRSFKTLVTKEIGYSIWQRSFHDHIIRDHMDYQKIWDYIENNVINWTDDCFYNN